MKNTLEIPLDLPEVKLEKAAIDEAGDFIITVSSTCAGTRCHRCGREIIKPYGHDREITLRHLPILGRKTLIRLRPKRYQCQACRGKPTTTQTLSWYDARSPHTKAYETQVLLLLVNSTVQDVSRKEGLGYEAVMGIIDRQVTSAVDWSTLTRLEIVGVDEIALRKGHRDFVTLVTARVAGTTYLLAVLDGREKATVKGFFERIPAHLVATIEAVCCDLYEGFINAAKEVFGPRVKVVADRFHVAKLYRKGLDRLRKQEMKRLKRDLPKATYQEFSGVMWLLRKDIEQLTEQEQRRLQRLAEYAPTLVMAYLCSLTLTRIFDTAASADEAKLALRAWQQVVQAQDLTCFDEFFGTLERHQEEITNYFINRHSSGFVEGLNNKIKVIKRRCYGVLNLGHLFQRIQLDLIGYKAFA
jgi:transposase